MTAWVKQAAAIPGWATPDNRGARRSHRPGASSAEAANLGLVRPPFVYLGSIALGLAVDYAWPVRLVPPSVSTPVGATLTSWPSACSSLQSAPSGQPARRRRATAPRRRSSARGHPLQPESDLSRLLAFPARARSLREQSGLLMTLVPAIALMALVVIPREERYLAGRFPLGTISCRAAVRRWL